MSNDCPKMGRMSGATFPYICIRKPFPCVYSSGQVQSHGCPNGVCNSGPYVRERLRLQQRLRLLARDPNSPNPSFTFMFQHRQKAIAGGWRVDSPAALLINTATHFMWPLHRSDPQENRPTAGNVFTDCKQAGISTNWFFFFWRLENVSKPN